MESNKVKVRLKLGVFPDANALENKPKLNPEVNPKSGSSSTCSHRILKAEIH